MTRSIFPIDQIGASARQNIGGSEHQWIVDELNAALSQHSIVVVGMKQNPFPKKARKLLDQAGKTYKYLEYGSYLNMWKPRLTLKMYVGWPTFPMIFVDGQFIGGARELEAYLQQAPAPAES